MRRPGLRANRHRWNPRWMSLESNRVVDARTRRGRRPTAVAAVVTMDTDASHRSPRPSAAAAEGCWTMLPLCSSTEAGSATGAVGDSGAASAGRLL
jgi:hypothetical protein